MSTKFQPLTDYLKQCTEPLVTLTFSQIEALIGGRLPMSAYEYDPYWHPSPTHSIALAYLRGGYVKESVSRTGQVLKLRKNPAEAASLLHQYGQ